MQKGLRQGCNLSPTLFDLNIEDAFQDLRDEDVGGIKIGGMLVQVLQSADVNISMIADSEKKPRKNTSKNEQHT